jgi:hypothetical protein
MAACSFGELCVDGLRAYPVFFCGLGDGDSFILDALEDLFPYLLRDAMRFL